MQSCNPYQFWLDWKTLLIIIRTNKRSACWIEMWNLKMIAACRCQKSEDARLIVVQSKAAFGDGRKVATFSTFHSSVETRLLILFYNRTVLVEINYDKVYFITFF